MRFIGLLLVCGYACSKQPDASAAGKTPTTAPPHPAVSAQTESAMDAGVAQTLDAQSSVAAIDAAPAGPPVPKVVLHTGDSMVGGFGGLTKALEAKFKPLGSKFVPDWMVSVSIVSFDHDKHFADLIARHNPDLVILTLGANDVFVPFPSSLASSVASIARKASHGRDCWWITPPTWKPDTGITAIIKKNAIGCRVFDSSNMKISRSPDGIHPTDRGGIDWADKFWSEYQTNPPPVAALLLDAGQ